MPVNYGIVYRPVRRHGLVLARRARQRVRLRVPGGPDIWVEVAEVDRRSGLVRLLFSAPREVEVMREELLPEEERMET